MPKFAVASPLFLQALPLSLKTFWRYLLVLPLLAIVPVVVVLAGFIPIIGILAPGVAYAYCIMIGLRCALVARGHTPKAEFGQMLRQGLIFSLLTMVATYLIEALSALLPLPIYLALGWFNGLANGDPRILIMAGGIFGLYILLMLIWSAALAVPMTAAVAYGDAKRGGFNPFRGLGAGIFGLTIINLVWLYCAKLLSYFGEVITTFALLSTAVFAFLRGEAPVWNASLDPSSLLGGTLLMVWASSWFFSAAVLYWERSTESQAASVSASIERVSASDLRALREARMPGRNSV